MWNWQKQNKVNKRRQNNNRGAGSIFLALLLVIAVAAGAFFFFRQEDSINSVKPTPAKVVVSDGKADYNQRCDALHNVIDKVLAGQNMVVSDMQRDTREVPRQKNEGKIVWNARSILLEATDAGTTEKLKRTLAAAVKQSGGVVLAMEPDRHHGFSATRIDVGLQDQLGGETLTIISDRLYISETVRKPNAVNRQKTKTEHKGEIALIIDDFGYRQDMIGEFAAIRKPFTFAVIPFKAFSKEAAAKGLASGHQVILHLPMEPFSGLDSAEIPNTVRLGMNEQQIRELMDKATSSLPGLVGMNNHQGSRATADKRTMEIVMRLLREKSLFFVDSRTSGQSTAAEVARREKVKTTENDLFLDGMAEEAYIKKQLRTAGEMALRLGQRHSYRTCQANHRCGASRAHA